MFFFEKVKEFFKKRSEIDTKDLDLLEETLIMSDIGLETSEKLINIIKKRVLTEKYISLSNLYSLLKEEILNHDNSIPILNCTIDIPLSLPLCVFYSYNTYAFHCNLPFSI